MAFVDDECDNPAANGYFDADIRKQEERHEVDGPETEDLLVLAYALLRVLRLLVRGLADLPQAVCRRRALPRSAGTSKFKKHGGGEAGDSPSWPLNLNAKAMNAAQASARHA